MPKRVCLCCFGLFTPLLLVAGMLAQAPKNAAAPEDAPATSTNRRIVLDVVAAPKSGIAVAGLSEKDFTLLDNNVPQPLTSFRALDVKEPLEVILLLDAVNTGTETIAFERGQIERFLKANGGRLAHPTTLAVSTDTGMQIQPDFSTDGNALSESLEKNVIALRTIRRSSGFFGAEERLQLSFKAISQLTAFEERRPGRKVILWVSPGWPLFSGPNTELSGKQQRSIFGTIVSLTDRLLQARITLYSIDPLGTADAGTLRVFYYQAFLKGVTKPTDATPGNLGLQVLATQSGGLALNSSNDVTKLLERCMADTEAYYELTFDAPQAEGPEEYHRLEVKLGETGLTGRTRQGYYSTP